MTMETAIEAAPPSVDDLRWLLDWCEQNSGSIVANFNNDGRIELA